MSFRIVYYLTLLTLVFTTNAHAALNTSDKLSQHIHSMVEKSFKTQKNAVDSIQIDILSSSKQLDGICDNPTLSFSGKSQKMTGNRTIIAQCGGKRHYVRINISLIGFYWVPNQLLQPGQPITAAQLTARKGRLDKLPSDVIVESTHIINKTPVRLIKPDQAITASLLRSEWAVLAGQEVSVVAIGSGYQVMSVGKAMDNAALHESLRFRTRNGQILSGKVIGKQKVEIIM